MIEIQLEKESYIDYKEDEEIFEVILLFQNLKKHLRK